MAVSTISATLYPSISIAAEHDFDAVFGIPALIMVKCFFEFIYGHEQGPPNCDQACSLFARSHTCSVDPQWSHSPVDLDKKGGLG